MDCNSLLAIITPLVPGYHFYILSTSTNSPCTFYLQNYTWRPGPVPLYPCRSKTMTLFCKASPQLFEYGFCIYQVPSKFARSVPLIGTILKARTTKLSVKEENIHLDTTTEWFFWISVFRRSYRRICRSSFRKKIINFLLRRASGGRITMEKRKAQSSIVGTSPSCRPGLVWQL